MNKRQWVIIGSLGLFLLLVVMALLAAENPVSVGEMQPQPVRAPAPVVAPPVPVAAPVAADAAPLPAPAPVPGAPGSAAVTMVDGSGSAAGVSLLLLALFVGTVGVSFGFLHLLRRRQAGQDRCVPHNTLAQGVPS
jgi:hypothetical protein